MKRNLVKQAMRYVLLASFAVSVGLIPLLLLFIGTREPGIDLHRSLAAGSTLEPFARILFGDGAAERAFRASIPWSFVYPTIAAAVAALLALFYALWASSRDRQVAIGMSFLMVTLVLLPQTYLVMPVLAILQWLPGSPAKPLIITLLETVAVIPLCAWIYHVTTADKLQALAGNCALDGMRARSLLLRVASETRTEFLLVLAFGWALAWANFVIPFSMGGRGSYTAVVQVATFTSNLGRDWAMIGAAGFLVSLPGLLLGLIVGVLVASSVRKSA